VYIPRSLDPPATGHPRRPNPDYIWEEKKFILENVLVDSLRRNTNHGGPDSIAALWEAERLHHQCVSSPRGVLLARLTDGDLEAVIEVARRYGFDHEEVPCLVPVPDTPIPDAEISGLLKPQLAVFSSEAEDIRLLRQLRHLAAQIIEWEKAKIISSTTPERRVIRDRLRRVDRAAAQGRRGRRPKHIGPLREIAVDYYGEVFRWRQVTGVLRGWPGSRREKVAVARRVYDLDVLAVEIEVPVDALLWPLGVRPDGEPTWLRLQPPETVAKLVTLTRFPLGDERLLSNLLAKYRVT
jgi:hypothetical protein